MSAVAAIGARAPLPFRARRAATVLFLWLAAVALIVSQYLLLRHLGSLNRELAATTGRFLLPSSGWRLSGTLLPLLLIGTALVLQRRWLNEPWREISGIGLVIFVPCAALCLFLAYFLGLRPLDGVQLPGGGSAIIALDDRMFTDPAFVLVEPANPGGVVWRRISDLDFIDGGPFARRPQLVASPDGRWLLVRRAGIWTDVFRLVDGHPVTIDVPMAWTDDDATFRRRRSERIATLTGLRP